MKNKFVNELKRAERRARKSKKKREFSERRKFQRKIKKDKIKKNQKKDTSKSTSYLNKRLIDGWFTLPIQLFSIAVKNTDERFLKKQQLEEAFKIS